MLLSLYNLCGSADCIDAYLFVNTDFAKKKPTNSNSQTTWNHYSHTLCRTWCGSNLFAIKLVRGNTPKPPLNHPQTTTKISFPGCNHYLLIIHYNTTKPNLKHYTVDSEIFARILFSRIVLKDILVMREIRD